MEITELDEVNEFQLDPTQHFELIRVVHLASTRLTWRQHYFQWIRLD